MSEGRFWGCAVASDASDASVRTVDGVRVLFAVLSVAIVSALVTDVFSIYSKSEAGQQARAILVSERYYRCKANVQMTGGMVQDMGKEWNKEELGVGGLMDITQRG